MEALAGSGSGLRGVSSDQPGIRKIQWRRASVLPLEEKSLEAGEDMRALIEFARQYESIREHPNTPWLERVFAEQDEVSEGSIQRRRNEGSGTVKNPHDPDAHRAAKDQAKTKQ